MLLSELRKSSGRSIEEATVLRLQGKRDPRVAKVELIERYFYERKGAELVLRITDWDVFLDGRSCTDDYGIKDRDEAGKFFQFYIANERGDFESLPRKRVLESIDVLKM